jgi:hypothetical protein
MLIAAMPTSSSSSSRTARVGMSSHIGSDTAHQAINCRRRSSSSMFQEIIVNQSSRATLMHTTSAHPTASQLHSLCHSSSSSSL